MAQYHRLSLMEREELSRMLAAGYDLRAVWQALSREPSPLSRELARQHASFMTYPTMLAQGNVFSISHLYERLRIEARHEFPVVTAF